MNPTVVDKVTKNTVAVYIQAMQRAEAEQRRLNSEMMAAVQRMVPAAQEVPVINLALYTLGDGEDASFTLFDNRIHTVLDGKVVPRETPPPEEKKDTD